MIKQMLTAVTAATMLVMGAGMASAGEFDPANSYMELKLGSVPALLLPALGTPLSVTLTDPGGNTHQIDENASLFSTTNYWVNSAAFTGLPAIDNLKISIHAGTGQFNDGFTAANSVGPGTIGVFGGLENITGQAVLIAGGFANTFPLNVLGVGGQTNISPVLNNNVIITGEPFGTQPVQITGITTNLLYSPQRGVSGVAFTLNLTTVELAGAFEITAGGNVVEVNTVTVNGFNNLQSASQPGVVKLASPFRLNTGNLAGNVPGALYKTFSFVPEPGTMLLLVSGAVGLALIGRNRMRK